MNAQEYFAIVGATLTLIAVAGFVVLVLNEIGVILSEYLKRNPSAGPSSQNDGKIHRNKGFFSIKRNA